MEFRTQISLPKIEPFLTHKSHIVTLGSCFADEVGNRLGRRLYNILVNPLGTLYNPVSIFNSIKSINDYKLIDEHDLISDAKGIWHSFNYHSRFSHPDKEIVISSVNEKIKETRKQIEGTDSVIALTFGSARSFRLKSTGEIVANCHKFPADWFEIDDMSVEGCKIYIKNSINLLRGLSKSLNIILTVSPIRHKSYGLHEDKLSKAKLLIAADEVAKELPNVYYFPAYEIMMDDLRDYRFYDSDMIHPSDVAIDYIFECFRRMFIPDKEQSLDSQCLKLFKRLNHRFINTDIAIQEEFNEETNRIMESIVSQYPEFQEQLRRICNERV